MSTPFNLRRVVAGLGNDGRSKIIIDGPPAETLYAGTTGLYEIWSDDGAPVEVGDSTDRGKGPIALMPAANGMLVRWFAIYPEGSEVEAPSDSDESKFEAMGGGAELVPGDRPGFHKTKSVDLTVVVSGSMRLIMQDGEVVLNAGDSVVMRGAIHDWEAVGDEPALCFCVVVDRDIV